MFKLVYKQTHNLRLARIRALAPKEYLDDGPMALYHAIKNMQAQGFDGSVEYCLLELERLYNLQSGVQFYFQQRSRDWFRK